MTSNYIKAKIDNLKTHYCQQLFDGEIHIESVKQIERVLVEKDEPDNYYQAEAIKQAIEWWEKLDELT